MPKTRNDHKLKAISVFQHLSLSCLYLIFISPVRIDLYAEVLKKPLGDVDAFPAKKTHYVQPYLSPTDVRRILDNLIGAAYLAACLIYGGGLCLAA